MIGRVLERFASWAVARKPFGSDTPKREIPPMHGFVIRGFLTDDPYITRVILAKLGKVWPMLHHIHRADNEREAHNHPALWCFSIVLCGEYDEERTDAAGRVTKRRVRWFNFLRSSDFHRITELHGDVWTFFVMGPPVQEWGFLVNGVLEPAKQYIARKKAEYAARKARK